MAAHAQRLGTRFAMLIVLFQNKHVRSEPGQSKLVRIGFFFFFFPDNLTNFNPALSLRVERIYYKLLKNNSCAERTNKKLPAEVRVCHVYEDKSMVHIPEPGRYDSLTQGWQANPARFCFPDW